MKRYPIDKVKNVCLLGHSSDGKTSLAEAMLFISKATDRLGKISEGNTVLDFDSEEIKRKASISSAIASCEWNGCKINIIDTPGYFDFEGEVVQAVRASDAAIIVVNGKSGIDVGTIRSYKIAKKNNLPIMFFVNRLDEPEADFYKVMLQLKKQFGAGAAPVEVPILDNGKLKGYLNLVSMKSKSYKTGEEEIIDIPVDMSEIVNSMHNEIFEAVAQTSDELMEKYFAGESFELREIIPAIHKGILDGDIMPVLCGAAVVPGDTLFLLDVISQYLPNLADKVCEPTIDGGEVEIKEEAAASAFVFKTVADPFVGKMSYFKVISGVIKADSALYNTTSGEVERISHLYVPFGKKQVEVDEIGAGDIGIVTKLINTNTGDTLCDASRKVAFLPMNFPKACLSLSIIPKSKGDEDKISQGLHKLAEEDLTFKYSNNTETKEQIVSGLGEMHVDVITSKLKNKFGVDVELKEPKVAYRETIKKKVKVQGKYKKQSGGHGQYGDVWIEFEHCDSDTLVFEENVFGGAVPKNFFPAVEKGLIDCVQKGVLAGFPVVGLKATLVDGSYHPVDSSEMSFKMAASAAYKAGLPIAEPTLLEPIGNLRAVVPSENMGDIIGDINKRRGQVLGMNPLDEGMQEILATVPIAEMSSYAVDLRSITRGMGYFDLEFAAYQDVMPQIAQKIIEKYKTDDE